MGKPDQPRDEKGRWTSRGSLAAVATASVVAVGGVSISAGGGGAASLDSAASQALKGKSSSKKSAQKGRQSEAWQRLGWRQMKKTAKRELKCGPNSFGEVQRFFLRHPCTDLNRMFVTVGDGAGNTIAVSVAWVKMPKAGQASDLRRLVDKDDTGNIVLFGEARPGTRFTGENYDSRLDRKLVVIAEAAPDGGRPSESTLETAVEVAVEFPAP
ncbi:hypothetical protein [Amycolatopsis pittospori]|uniref:hypothetical protein n=1 Tax=Amycolatopsis pittospori TaxID=2749434 RepID=UPI001F3C3550|nr:hypothetical protein [Amycolatopsis pittospori]